jgi:uncharacterized protein YwqG
MRESGRKALHLAAGGDGASKIGGLPHLPASLEWPQWKGERLAFLAQVALAELPRPAPLAELPTEGMLYFFYDPGQSTWGFDPADRGSWRVLYAPAAAGAPREAPADLPREAIHPEKRVRFRPIDSYPGWERLQVPAGLPLDESGPLIDAAYAAKSAAYGELPQHQVGGYPSPQQGDEMELECQLASHGVYCGDPSGYDDPRVEGLRAGASQWTLLLQLDSDEDVAMMWGDLGMLYFWIRSADLERRDFSGVWMVLQCG